MRLISLSLTRRALGTTFDCLLLTLSLSLSLFVSREAVRATRDTQDACHCCLLYVSVPVP